MKRLIISLVGTLTALSIYAQTSSVVSIAIAGNKNLQLFVNGKQYRPASNNITGTSTSLLINNLRMGQHTFQATRTDQNTNITGKTSATFTLRSGYDMLIKLNPNGSLELIETSRTNNWNSQAPMTSTSFNKLLSDVKIKRSVRERRMVIAAAFEKSNNFFTTSQVVQLLTLVNSENFRLQLAKLSYRAVTDRNNFDKVYELLNSQSSENELRDYVSNYNGNGNSNGNSNSNGNDNGNSNVAMSVDDFNSLHQSIRKQWPVETQINSLTTVFNSTSNSFTTNQAIQLIQLIGFENSRLELAKLSYRSITDRANFNRLFMLLNSQTSKDELTDYVNNYVNNGGAGYNNSMTDADFNNLYQEILQQWPLSTQMSSLKNAFATHAFTVYQASRLIELVKSEDNRLSLAKLSYRSITDPANFSKIYDLLYVQTSKDQLSAYVSSYTTGNQSNMAMSDASFNNLYNSIQMQIFPGEKMIALVAVFNNSENYFSSLQAKQLVLLVSQESNRLQLAKLSYRAIVDRNNFSQLYDVLDNQSSRNELESYVRGYKV